MANRSFPSTALLAVCVVVVAALALVSVAEAGGLDEGQLGWALGSRCSGSIAECLGAEEEFEMDTESNRRILATSNYISYGALQRNTVPCSQRGASYYNCRPGAQSNPYSRGCSNIARCRS
ncbi:rapid alkalinization factor-like [Punica granatum]|uniref:Rapid alkalinization factor-like n=2 Tax=Punica granatum TaxID=22663 RepID=A0A6P8CJM0_PUNGR|nr:rapid alkalinization factor-like [Punica granatum]PKI74034.1 hypothetical protein CRG98_005512 [Punica granatum]